ncbi:MAG: UDP-N-acetylglucosamine 2-epimerase (non-hydrolyzing) [Chloroflexi bacterium]|nr:UDP-N-acetylglucosamine 2-epimerase (non-hydrolyzing) [Chloroflexota bacterium]
MKIVSIVGARPEFVQVAPLSAALRRSHQEVLLHTGQHYDYLMSEIFLHELGLPAPDYNLGVGSGSHGRQTGELLADIERVLLHERPDWVIVRGDTNSTLAGGLAAAKLGIPVAHIESGARSFDRSMPEELNRVLVDHLSSLLFCVAPNGVTNLEHEGITEGVYNVGDVMYDALLQNVPIAHRTSSLRTRLGVQERDYVLATVHRAGNTDDPARLRSIVAAINAIEGTVVFPVHPRTRAALDRLRLGLGDRVLAIEPVGYHDMLMLEAGARVIVTDSGGVTRESYLLGVPCVTLREQTEHVETVTVGWNCLAGADTERIVDAVRTFRPTTIRPPVFGDGHAAERIVQILETGASRFSAGTGGSSVPEVASAAGRV